MNYTYDPKEMDRVAAARESFSGRLLTDAQFDESMALTGILEREIHKSGSFKEKLGDYAYAFARSERFDAVKSETILRDLFKERTGQTMNQMREELAKREENFTDEQRQIAYQHACDIGQMMEEGNKLSFHRTAAHQAQTLATEFGITDAGAKRLMAEEFKAAENSELYDWGKELDEQHYRPQIDAEKAEREQSQSRGQSRGRTKGQAGGNGQTQRRSSYPSRSGPR